MSDQAVENDGRASKGVTRKGEGLLQALWIERKIGGGGYSTAALEQETLCQQATEKIE